MKEIKQQYRGDKEGEERLQIDRMPGEGFLAEEVFDLVPE